MGGNAGLNEYYITPATKSLIKIPCNCPNLPICDQVIDIFIEFWYKIAPR